MNDDITTLLQATLRLHLAPEVRIVAAEQRAGGEQGYSGATLRYYDVTYARADAIAQTTLVTKDAPLLERRIHSWLSDRGLPVPYCYTSDLATGVAEPLCMQYLEHTPATGERASLAAQALASIHHATLGQGGALAWLPRADPTFLADWLIDACWRRGWQSVLAGEGHIDAYGRHYGPPKPGGDFASEFAAYTQPLEETAARFLRAMTLLWDADETLTLIHGDFHDAHLRIQGGSSAVIDWGQARYGPLYLDLPNVFARTDALYYREALSALGHTIPQDAFLAGYDAARAYVGFKYFGIGLTQWCYGDPPHQRERVQYWIDLALRG